MRSIYRTTKVELIKIRSSRVWLIICVLLVVIQPLLAFLAAKSFVKIGLGATPETHPQLAQALPPLDYLGFSSLIGNLPMVIFGGIIGASEYKHHQLRTTLLCQSSRIKVFFAKVLGLLVCSVFISLLTIYATISTTHIGLGEQGLHPFYLSTITWQFIGFSALNWILLTILSFGIGMLFRNALVPLAFLVPQLYNLGSYLAQRWEWGEYLPVAAGNLLIASPTDPFKHDPLQGGIVLLIWVLLALSMSYYAFIRSDVGGKY